jgi:UDPglucose--hexose-1-phosphate uridylyltransferase
MEKIKTYSDVPHKRYNPLTGEWILVSPHRTKRPWQGKEEEMQKEERPAYVDDCYLCPGNQRAGGHKNPEYEQDFLFTNDFASLLPDTDIDEFEADGLFKGKTVQGTCKVICFTPRHDMTLAEMAAREIENVINLWQNQTEELGKKFQWVQIFENKGSMMGCSNPHPHGQIWAIDDLPVEARKENINQKQYFKQNNSPMLLDYSQKESELKNRTIAENSSWIIVVPYWAFWPFETLVLPKFKVASLPQLDQRQKSDLAAVLKNLLVRYDNLFNTPFPYTMGWHQAPFGKDAIDHWTLHGHFYPPLLRSATVKKFRVGYEMLAESQRDLTAEKAAQYLNQQPVTHYKKRME